MVIAVQTVRTLCKVLAQICPLDSLPLFNALIVVNPYIWNREIQPEETKNIPLSSLERMHMTSY